MLRSWKRMWAGFAVLVIAVFVNFSAGATGDADGNGFVDSRDLRPFLDCFQGPAAFPGFECTLLADFNQNGTVDLADAAGLQLALGHLPIPLRDSSGSELSILSTAPYSGRQTCGTAGCHNVDQITNGFIHQQGRTDPEGNIVMRDNYFNDGRWWIRSAGMYGRWSPGGGGLNRQTAGKTNKGVSSMDMTAFYWAGHCGGCHAGGGGMEFDRDGERYWDEAAGTFGFEALGKTAKDVVLDGDYTLIDDADGSIRPAPWDATGVAEPECLHCHRAERNYVNFQDMHREWRAQVLGAGERLVDANGDPIPAFASAGTAGQGWFSQFDVESDPPVLRIDYTVALARNEVELGRSGELYLPERFLAFPPRDQACWGCHLPGGFQNKRGTLWFDERDVHFKKFTNRSDENPNNDLPDKQATTCNYCHPGSPDHNFAKGDSPYAKFRPELDWADFRSCRECHLYDSPVRHPDAPEVLGPRDEVLPHLAGDVMSGPMAKLACQACHVPYPLSRAVIVTDRSLTGSDEYYFTDAFLSADPLNPADSDKSKWYPALQPKVDSDGRTRFFPQKMEVAIYWADWDTKGTPKDRSDDVIHPIILWRLRGITGNQPLPIVTDDNSDGRLEVNRPEEILAYMQLLKGKDRYGMQVAVNPVLVKGRHIWYEDSSALDGVASLEIEGSGLNVVSFEVFGLDHNVLHHEEAWGVGELSEGCNTCHAANSPVFDRLILVDPYGPDGKPVYETVSDMTGLDPP